WVAEGIAWRRAAELYASRFQEGREVKDWIGLFNIFAIVDRFETAPRIPFLRSFFPVSTDDEPLAIRPETLCVSRPPGRFVFDKLEARMGPTAFEAMLAGYRSGRQPFRESLAATSGGVGELLDAWLRPYVPIDYAIEDVERNPG